MEKQAQKQSTNAFEKTRRLVKKSGYNHTAIAVEAKIGYPRYRRLIIDGMQPTEKEKKQILEAIKTLVERDKVRLASLEVA